MISIRTICACEWTIEIHRRGNSNPIRHPRFGETFYVTFRGTKKKKNQINRVRTGFLRVESEF